MLGNSDETSHLHHEEVVGAVLKRFPIVGAVDVVLNLQPAHRILGLRLDRRYLVYLVVDRPKTRQRLSLNRLRKEGER